MNIDEIHKELDELAALMVTRDFVYPRAECWLKNGDRYDLHLWFNAEESGFGGAPGLESFGSGIVDESIRNAKAWIVSQPTKAERERQSFMNSLGKLIDQGRNAGIELDYLNPLSTTMMALSENVITKLEAAE